MIEKTVLDYLNDELPVSVFAEVPENVSESYCVIELVGAGEENHVFSASIAIQSYAPTLFEAAELNEDVIAAMFAFPEEENIGRCALASSYNFTDTASKRYRYQSVFDIYYVKEDSING